jgi:hypothetical protein
MVITLQGEYRLGKGNKKAIKHMVFSLKWYIGVLSQ